MKHEGILTPQIGPENLYNYTGKENQMDFGLNLIDYGARMYDPAIARWSTVDPLGAKMPSWSPYNYVLGNPIQLVDPDGREPVKALAGTVWQFKSLLNNSPSGVGNYTGQAASNYLRGLGSYEMKGGKPEPTQTGYFNNKQSRYIYTKDGGWMDMSHFMFYAGTAYAAKLDGEENPVGEAVQAGYRQEATDEIFAPHSAYSYEDLPSDKYGADFGANHFDPNSSKTFSEQLVDYLKGLGAASPTTAPNYNGMPQSDSKNPPSSTNGTTTPIFTTPRSGVGSGYDDGIFDKNDQLPPNVG